MTLFYPEWHYLPFGIDMLETLINIAPSRPVFIFEAPGIGKAWKMVRWAVSAIRKTQDICQAQQTAGLHTRYSQAQLCISGKRFREQNIWRCDWYVWFHVFCPNRPCAGCNCKLRRIKERLSRYWSNPHNNSNSLKLKLLLAFLIWACYNKSVLADMVHR